ncbi:hypothetical protein Tco_1427980 [Tanacetum coccineum]
MLRGAVVGNPNGQLAKVVEIDSPVTRYKPSCLFSKNKLKCKKDVRKRNDYTATAFFNVGCEPADPITYLPDGFMERTKGVGLVLNNEKPI